MRATWPKVFGKGWRGLVLASIPMLVGMGAIALAPRASATQATGAVGLSGVRFGGDASVTRVVLDLDGAVVGKMLADDRSGRLVIALPPVLSSGPLQGRGHGLVTGWSLRDDGRGARLVLDLAPGATALHRFLIPPTADGGLWRYVIDIKAGGNESDPLAALAGGGAVAAPPAVRPAPIPAREASTAPTPPPAPLDVAPKPVAHVVLASRPAGQKGLPSRGLKVIVIDAGHGGHDPGARSLVRNEKDITLAAALELKARLLKMGRFKVVLTRDSDVYVPLETRVQIARHAGADLFISLHADSAGSDPTPHGASVYTLSDHGETRVNYVLGSHEWFAHAGDRPGDAGVRQILLDLTQTSTRNRSSQFAGMLIGHIGDKVDLLPRSHRDAGYFVLLAPDVPAVLLEMGFITNPADEMRLTDPAQRQGLMDGVAEAIDAYFSATPHLAAG